MMIHKGLLRLNRHSVITLCVLLVSAFWGAGCSPAGEAPAGDIERLLVWIGEGASPASKTPGVPGDVGYLQPDGSVKRVLPLPSNATWVTRCGTAPVSPDGQHFAFFVSEPQGGTDLGTLYQLSNAAESAQPVAQTQGLACAADDAFRYSPDSQHLAFIDFAPINARVPFASGTLRVLDTASLSEQVSVANAAAFALEDTRALVVSFFTNVNGQADEAAVLIAPLDRDATSAATEVVTLFPAPDCRFVSASVANGGEGRIAAALGHNCPGDPTTVQLYSVDTAARSAALIMDMPVQGDYSNTARSNRLVAGADDSSVFLTAPDGRRLGSGSLRRVDLDAPSPDDLIIAHSTALAVHVPQRFTLPEHALSTLSPDGRWLAWVRAANDAQPELHLLDLSAPQLNPVILPAPSIGDRIPFVAFSPDSARVFYTAGTGETAAVYRVDDLNEGAETLLARGAFGVGVVAPDGGSVLVMGTDAVEGVRPYTHTDLYLLTEPGTTPTLRFEGLVSDPDSGEPSGARFAVPLHWWP